MSEVKNAVISSAEITFRERGLLDCWLSLDYGGSGQGFGGYALYLPKSFSHHSVMSVAGHHIFRCMEVAGVEDWSKMAGRPIRVRLDKPWGKIMAIGHVINDDWYSPEEDFSRAIAKAEDR